MELRKPTLYFVYLLFTFFIVMKVSGQSHNNYWLKGVVQYPLTSKVDIAMEFHHRSQNDLGSNSPLSHNLLNAIRPLVFYKAQSGIRLFFSPLAYFENYRIIQSEIDLAAKPKGEWRITFGAEFHHTLNQRLEMMHRTGFEYRIFDINIANVIRVRNRIDFSLQLNSFLKINAGDELMVNASGYDIKHFFDQNRIIVNSTFKLSNHFKIELGFIKNNRLSNKSLDHIHENNITSAIIYTFSKAMHS